MSEPYAVARDATVEPEEVGRPRGRRRAAWVAMAVVATGLGTWFAGVRAQEVLDDGRLVLVAGVDGKILVMLLWLVTCVCAVVLGVVGFRLFVVGYEAFTAIAAAVFLCAWILAACVAALFVAFLALLGSGSSFTTLDGLDRERGHQIVIEDDGSTYGPPWRLWVGGPFVFDEISLDDASEAECATLRDSDRSVSVEGGRGEHLLTTDRYGRDVLMFATDVYSCRQDGPVRELVLPD